jgi:hypothetical protein
MASKQACGWEQKERAQFFNRWGQRVTLACICKAGDFKGKLVVKKFQ